MKKALEAHAVVGGGTVERWDGQVVEAEVDAELGAVVDQVVEEHAAVGGGTGLVGDDRISEAELPGLLEVGIAGFGECGSGFGGKGIEGLKQLFTRLKFQGGEFGGGEIHARRGENVSAEAGQAGDVDGETAHGHGFVMTLEIGLVGWDALKRGAGSGHFVIEVLEENFCDSH